MFVRIKSGAYIGLNCYLVDVEVDSSKGLPGQSIVGLPDASVKESRDRVKAAICNSGYEFPLGYFTINLAPADTRKEGPMYDLPIAIGILGSSGQVPMDALKDTAVFGELSLDGALRSVEGILPMCMTAVKNGIKKVIVPKDNADEAALVRNIDVIPAVDFNYALDYLNGKILVIPHKVNIEAIFENEGQYDIDFSEIKGQFHVKRAIEIACAGSHNIMKLWTQIYTYLLSLLSL